MGGPIDGVITVRVFWPHPSSSSYFHFFLLTDLNMIWFLMVGCGLCETWRVRMRMGPVISAWRHPYTTGSWDSGMAQKWTSCSYIPAMNKKGTGRGGNELYWMRGENGVPKGNLVTNCCCTALCGKQASFQLTSKLRRQRLTMWRGLGSSASILMWSLSQTFPCGNHTGAMLHHSLGNLNSQLDSR